MPPEDFEPPELKIVITNDKPDYRYCTHEQIKIFPHHRIIQCSECGARLDPFEHLLAVGRKEGNQLSNITYLSAQVKRYSEEIEKLKKEILKLKKERNGLER
jgi:hypothetical protein